MRAAPVLLLVLGACAPLGPYAAERACYPEAAEVRRNFADLRFGTGSGAVPVIPGLPVEHATDHPPGGSPEAVWSACIQRLSGQAPQRPFADVPQGLVVTAAEGLWQ